GLHEDDAAGGGGAGAGAGPHGPGVAGVSRCRLAATRRGARRRRAPLRVAAKLDEEGDMVLGYHVVFTAYGFWLPNDPRGSWSDFVGAWELFVVGGKATTTTERRALHRDSDDRAKRPETKQ